MTRYILIFDVGNSTIVLGRAALLGPDQSFASGHVQELGYMETPAPSCLETQALAVVRAQMTRMAKLHGVVPEQIAGAVASSVVPHLEEVLDRVCKELFGVSVCYAARDIAVPLQNNYYDPHQLGPDRLLAAWAARRLQPQQTVLVVDAGSATTIDVVHGDTFAGGFICPGVGTAAKALGQGTARLPLMPLGDISDEILWGTATQLSSGAAMTMKPGRSTQECMGRGFIFGMGLLVEGMCNRLCEAYDGDVAVVATGGYATALSRVTDIFDRTCPTLLLDGLFMLYEESNAL